MNGIRPREAANQIWKSVVDGLVSIELFGQVYTFRASGQVPEPEEVADYVAGHVEKVRASAKTPSQLDTLILVALNIANEYLEMKGSRQELVGNIDERCKTLIKQIDAGV
ncbi:MAG: hypothetical protein BA861_02590 [Desulfobacterales bacterium S3730MH5]|nr:MAG: hypothetical protein BA861_02590 [Desulfobacterales bacterium S3730MH5]OEU82387.1 MAG: hypothetical protein BA865_03000 [Desulfobacterales bacterium S5133MH4]